MPDWYENQWQAILLVQALLGTVVFAYALERRKGFWFRLVVSLPAGMALVHGLKTLLWPLGQPGEVLTISVLYLLLIGILCLCWKMNLWTAMFVASSGYIAQDVASRMKTIFRFTAFGEELVASTPGALLVDLVFYGGIYCLAFLVFRPYTQRGNQRRFDNRLKAIFSVLVLFLCAWLSRLLYGPLLGELATRAYIAYLCYQILCGVFVLLLQYGVLERTELTRQMETMRELVHQQHVQYEASRENAQLVNEKYHDLKRLLENFRQQVPPEQLLRLERKLDATAPTHTGSEVLDVVLSEKRAQCEPRGVLLTCYADGSSLDFVEELDLYTLLNNALQNAMEAASAMPVGERFITMTVTREGAMAALHIENSCAQPVRMVDGLPQTGGDPRYHGFGVRSMLRAAERYGGTLTTRYDAQVFSLDILLFAPEEQAESVP